VIVFGSKIVVIFFTLILFYLVITIASTCPSDINGLVTDFLVESIAKLCACDSFFIVLILLLKWFVCL
jgi:hypothetical protein